MVRSPSNLVAGKPTWSAEANTATNLTCRSGRIRRGLAPPLQHDATHPTYYPRAGGCRAAHFILGGHWLHRRARQIARPAPGCCSQPACWAVPMTPRADDRAAGSLKIGIRSRSILFLGVKKNRLIISGLRNLWYLLLPSADTTLHGHISTSAQRWRRTSDPGYRWARGRAIPSPRLPADHWTDASGSFSAG